MWDTLISYKLNTENGNTMAEKKVDLSPILICSKSSSYQTCYLKDKHSSSPLSSRGGGRGEGRGGGTDRSGDATPTSEGEGRAGDGLFPGGAVSLSAAIPRISTQHSGVSLSVIYIFLF